MRNAVRHVAIVWPASSAVVSKATPILAASSANRVSSLLAMPAWPAAATILPMSVGTMGRRRDSSSMSRPIFSKPSGVSKSTTFFTSAMADSKLMACAMGSVCARRAPNAANATPVPWAAAFMPALWILRLRACAASSAAKRVRCASICWEAAAISVRSLRSCAPSCRVLMPARSRLPRSRCSSTDCCWCWPLSCAAAALACANSRLSLRVGVPASWI